MVVRRGSSRGGSFSERQPSRPDVLVWRFESGLGRHGRRPGRLRSLVGGRGLSLGQPQGVAGGAERSVVVSGPFLLTCSSGVFQQHHSSVISSEARRDIFTGPQRGVAADTSLGRGDHHHHPSPVCSRSEQCGSQRSVSPQSGDRGRMDSATGGLRLDAEEVAGDSGPFCILTESPLWCLFCSGVLSHGCGYRCHAPALGFSSCLHLSTVRPDSAGSGEALIVAGCSSHADRSILASEGVVPGSSRSPAGTASSSSGQVGSAVPAACAEVPPKPLRARRLSGDSPKPSDSLRRWLVGLAAHIDHLW